MAEDGISVEEVLEAEVLYEGKPQSLYEELSELDPARADAVIALADGLIQQAGPMWDALVEIAEENTAKGFAEIITDQVLAAALPLVPDE